MIDVPRLAWPPRLNGTGLAIVEQDSDEDIAQCILAVVRTRIGDRADLPDMGVPDMTFEEQPVDLDGVREALSRHEPRASVLASTNPDAIDTALALVDLTWDRLMQPDNFEEG